MRPRTDKAFLVTQDVLSDIVPMGSFRFRWIIGNHKAATARRYCDEFCGRMQTDAPFASEDEAINSLAPMAVWIFGWAARQFAILVIRALWRRWHQE